MTCHMDCAFLCCHPPYCASACANNTILSQCFRTSSTWIFSKRCTLDVDWKKKCFVPFAVDTYIYAHTYTMLMPLMYQCIYAAFCRAKLIVARRKCETSRSFKPTAVLQDHEHKRLPC